MKGGLIIFCWVALAATTLMNVGGAAIGAAYYPENAGKYFIVALAPVVVIAVLLWKLPGAVGTMRTVLACGTILAGVGLVGFFGLQMLRDAGDAVLWSPPVALGAGLIWLAFQALTQTPVEEGA